MIPFKCTTKRTLFLIFLLLLGVIFNIAIANAELPPYLDLTINEEKFLPNETFIVKAYLYNSPVQGDIELRLVDSNGNLVFKKFVTAETTTEYTFESDATIGDWQIIASYDGISAKRTISIGKKEAIYTRIIDGKLIIKNIGNIPYIKPIKIIFVNERGEEEIKIMDLSLALNEEVEFQLQAKTGVYDVIVEGSRFNSVALTGKVASTIQLNKKPGFLLQYPITAFLIFVVLIVFIVLLTSRLREKPFKFYDKKGEYIEIEKRAEKTPFKEPSPSLLQNAKIETKTAPVTKEREFSIYPSRKAEHSLVLQGNKQGTTIVVVNAKNLSELKNKLETATFDGLREFLEKQVSMEIEENKGILQRVSDYSLMGIFSASTKQFRHEMAAVKAALKIRVALENYNHKLKDKLEYGIGVNTGELIVSTNKVMQYTSMGNTIALAKKLAEMSKNEVYTVSDTYSRITPEAKGTKIGSINTSRGSIDIYSVKNVGGREVYKSYLTDILNRMKKE